MKNVAKASEILVHGIWSRTVNDVNATVAEYIHPETDEGPVVKKTKNGTENMFARANICCK